MVSDYTTQADSGRDVQLRYRPFGTSIGAQESISIAEDVIGH